jgi:hypothetical protein
MVFVARSCFGYSYSESLNAALWCKKGISVLVVVWVAVSRGRN